MAASRLRSSFTRRFARPEPQVIINLTNDGEVDHSRPLLPTEDQLPIDPWQSAGLAAQVAEAEGIVTVHEDANVIAPDTV